MGEAEKAAFEAQKVASTTEVVTTAAADKQSYYSGVPAGPASAWNVDQVVQFIETLGFGHIVEAFRDNGVDGEMLAGLSEEELCAELKLTKLQAKKVRQRLPQ